MFASSNYPPDQQAADEFVAQMRHGTLIACAPGGHPQVSILPFVRGGGYIELHCVQGDPTLEAVRANPLVTFFVSDFLAWSPHDWVDPVDAGKATLHFRAGAFECQAEDVSTDPEAVAGARDDQRRDAIGIAEVDVGEFGPGRPARPGRLGHSCDASSKP